jgi:Tfp pilus assembly protein PilF
MNDRLKALIDFYNKDPKDSFVIYGIALEYMSLNNYTKAEEFFNNLLTNDPDYVAGYMQYAQMKTNINEINKSKELYKKGIQVAKKVGDNRSAKEMEEFLDELE